MFFDSPIRRVGLEQKLPKVFQWKLSLFIWFAMGLTYNFHVKKGALKSKYSCAVHSDFYCFASADMAFCTWPLALCTQIFVDRCAAMKSECTINVTSFQYKWRLIVRSYFHRCTSADVFRYRSMSPFMAERCHSDKTWHHWASVDVHHRPMHSDEVWTHHNGAFRLHRCAS